MKGALVGAVVALLVGCSSSVSDSGRGGGGGVGGGSTSGNLCPMDAFESAQCTDPFASCNAKYSGPTGGLCVDGWWRTVLPAVAPSPFPEQTACDPFGYWLVTTDVPVKAQCLDDEHSKLVIHQTSAGQVQVGFGQVSYAEVSSDGCKVIVETHKAYKAQTTMYHLELDFSLSPPKGKLRLSQLGTCSANEVFTATASLQMPDG